MTQNHAKTKTRKQKKGRDVVHVFPSCPKFHFQLSSLDKRNCLSITSLSFSNMKTIYFPGKDETL